MNIEHTQPKRTGNGGTGNLPPAIAYAREQYLEKAMPASADSERVILGAILIDNMLFPQVLELVKPDDFYSPLHRHIFAAMTVLFATSKKIEPILIGEELKKTGQLENIGGVATITNLTYGLPHFSDLRDYCRVVAGKAKIRNLIKTCNVIINTCLAEEDDPDIVLEQAQSEVNEVCTSTTRKTGFVPVGTLGKASLERALQMAKDGTHITGTPTGFAEIDQLTSGLQKTDLIIVAARPSMGKSSLLGNVATNCCHATQNKAVVAIFSLEMSKEQYSNRLLCSLASVDLTRYQRGFLTKDEWARLAEAKHKLDDYRIFIDDESTLTPLQMRGKLLRLLAEQKRLDLVGVDFLQKMHASKRTESRQQEVGMIARELKNVAKDFKVPLMALSSLSRAPEARNPPKPILSDLRESGDIESEADVVAFIYREHYYKREADPSEADLSFAKNRHGATGLVKLNWLAEFTRFGNRYDAT